MGDRAPAGAAQKHDSADLRRAARTLRQLASDFDRDAVTKFTDGMRPYTLDLLTAVADERSRRIRGKSYDHAKAESTGVTSGATSDWLNPFGRFHEGDAIQERMDTAYQAAVRDGRHAIGEIQRMADALESAADFYDTNEGTNTQLTKAIMDRFLSNKPAADQT